jgi:hypothetical protein
LKYISLDIRALSLMRICVASVVILDLCIRLSDLEAFYSNTGVVPLTLLFEHAWNDYYLSIHTMSGLWQVQLLIFCAALFCALMLLLGFRTRLFTGLSWFLMLSLHNRNELILQGGDDLLRTVLFWAIFLPWGARYSLDHLFYPSQDTTLQLRNWATLAYILQVSYVYTGSALLKGPEWNCDFNALYYVYSLDQITYPVSRYLYMQPGLMCILTAVAYYFELLVPLLFFMPVGHSFFRISGVILVVGFHAFNGMTIFIGLFFLIGIATIMGILPSSAMDLFDRLTVRLRNFITGKLDHISSVIRFAATPVRMVGKPPLALVFLVLYVLYWNLSNFTFMPFKMGDSIRFIGYTLRLDQCWGMFAPGVFKDDGWYIYEGQTKDGRRIDLLHPNQPLTYKKPQNIVGLFRNDRWRKYGENFILKDHCEIRGYFCNYYMRVWNEEHPKNRIKSLRVIYMYELSRPNYEYFTPEQEVLFECGE